MASDKKDSKKSKDLSSRKEKGMDKRIDVTPRSKDTIKIEVRKKDTLAKKKPQLGVTAEELYAGTGQAPPKESRSTSSGKAPSKVTGPSKKKAPLLCPDCGHELEDGISKCPNCGVELAEGEEEIVCAICGGVLNPHSDICPLCGTKLTMATQESKSQDKVSEALVPIEDISRHHHDLRKDKERPIVEVSPEELRRIKAPKKGQPVPTTTTIKGKAKVKGKGKAKGRRAPPPKKGMLEGPAVVPLVLIVILIMAVVIVSVMPKTTMAVDGNFNDWGPVTKLKDTAQPGASDGSQILEYSVKLDGNKVFLYMKANGKIFAGSSGSPTVVNVFIDADRDSGTGYLVGSIGAERRLELKGWDGKVQTAIGLSFEPGADQNDWNKFTQSSTLEAKSSGSELELCKDLAALGMNKDSSPAILIGLRTSSGSFDMSEAPMGLVPGGIVVTQTLKAPKTPVAPGTQGQVLMTIKLEAKATDDTFKTLKLTRLGQGPVGDVSLVTLWNGASKLDDGKFVDSPTTGQQMIELTPQVLVKKGSPVVLTIKMDIWEKSSGKTLGAMIMSASDALFSKAPAAIYTVQEEELRGYLNKTPSLPSIDGAFADWTSSNSNEKVYLGNGPRPNIDLKVLRTKVLAPGKAYFEVEVVGNMLLGSPMPGYEAKNGTCTKGPACPESGESLVIVYIDADNKTTTGKPLGAIGADYAAIIHGKDGRVDMSSMGFYDYDSGKDSWEIVSDKGVTAYNDLHKIELEIDLTKSGLTPPGNDYRYILELKDQANYSTWSGVIDG